MVQFKLQHRGLVRKVTFKNVDQPSWHELSWKIGDVCNIPHAAVGLAYLDPDGDKITISSQAELKEYYSSLDEDDLDSNVPHKFIVRNLNDGAPDPDAADPSEDNFLLRDARTMAASTVGGGSQWGFNAEDEAERDPAKLRLSGYSTFADALSPLAGSATEPEDDRSEKDELPGGFNAKPQTEESPPAPKTSGGWGLPLPGFGWGRSSTTNPQTNTQTVASSPPADSDVKSSNPWSNNIEMTAKTPSWAAASATPTSTKAPPTPWGAPVSVATGGVARPGLGGKGGAPTASTTTTSARDSGSTVRPSTYVPPPVAPTVQMDSMVADRASSYAASSASFPKGGKKNKKKMTHREREAERQREEEARREEESRIEEAEQRAMEREADRERQENARYSAEAASRAAAEEARRVAERESKWERERERLQAEEEQRKREPPRHAHQNSDAFSEWQHVQEQHNEQEQEDEEAYRARIEAARANVFGTAAPPTQSQPRPRKVSTKGKSEKSSGKSSRPNSKVYPPTPAPKKFFDPDLMSENGQSSLNVPNDYGHVPTTPGHSAPVTPGRATDSKAQVCNDVADLLGSFKRILDSEPDLLDAIREAFARGPASGALNAAFGDRNLSPEMLRIVSSVDELLTKILPNRPAASPYVPSNMELEPRIPTPSVTPTPVVPGEPEFGVPPSDYGNSFEYANRGRQGGVPLINVPRPKYPASSLTREGYSTGTTPPATSSGYSYARTGGSPERSAHTRSRSRPPPGDFEIVPPSQVPPQARMVIPPPVVPGEETDSSPITPGFARKSSHDGGLALASSSQQGPASIAKADMENAKQHYKSQRELYKLEKAERKKEMEERAAAKAERRRAKAA
ncbi:hypothetical protein FRC10_007276 [Ceratobasidium sp. 414]|nr:hypothetical protein FRC10_007276 [Ceratobasidium sp. 414]